MPDRRRPSARDAVQSLIRGASATITLDRKTEGRRKAERIAAAWEQRAKDNPGRVHVIRFVKRRTTGDKR